MGRRSIIAKYSLGTFAVLTLVNWYVRIGHEYEDTSTIRKTVSHERAAEIRAKAGKGTDKASKYEIVQDINTITTRTFIPFKYNTDTVNISKPVLVYKCDC